MFTLVKPVFIAFLNFGESLATKFMSLNNEPCLIGPILIKLNPAALNYYPFMISKDKCSESYNFVDDLSTKICVPSKTKEKF